ncbi:MAG: restriction endonuclease subunit S [bacterium]|nr:restriction endonuclease subunit S [bacterium]
MVFSIIQKSQLEGALRLDAEYYQPEYFIDFAKGSWQPIGDFLKQCQYGLSYAMNTAKSGYPIFKMDNIENAFLFNDNLKYVQISREELNDFRLKKDDILFNRVNAEEFVGRTGIFKLNLESVFASYLIRLEVKQNSAILPDYLNIFLNSSFGIKQIQKIKRRAVNQANVNAEELKQIKIAILPILSQNKIKQLVDNSWKDFELAQSLYQKSEEIFLHETGIDKVKNVIVETHNFTVVSLADAKNSHRIDAEYFNSPCNKMLAQIIKGKTAKLGDLVEMTKGIEPGAEAYQDEGKLFIRVSSVSKDGIIDKDQKYLSDDLYNEYKKDYQPQVGDILLTKDASPGTACVVREPIEGIVASGVMRLKLKEKMNPEYLALVLNSIIGRLQAERDAGGSIIAHWKPEQIKNLVVPILPVSIQEKIADLVIKSHTARKKAKELLGEAKRKVEEMIEKGGDK